MPFLIICTLFPIKYSIKVDKELAYIYFAYIKIDFYKNWFIRMIMHKLGDDEAF